MFISTRRSNPILRANIRRILYRLTTTRCVSVTCNLSLYSYWDGWISNFSLFLTSVRWFRQLMSLSRSLCKFNLWQQLTTHEISCSSGNETLNWIVAKIKRINSKNFFIYLFIKGFYAEQYESFFCLGFGLFNFKRVK